MERLLDLQARDTRADQLRHRRATLRERVRLEELTRRLDENEVAATDKETARHELARRQKRLEDEVAAIEAKLVEVDRTLYGGTVRSPRELQALQDEIGALRRRQRSLEDQILDVMEETEPLDRDLATLGTDRGEVEAAVEEVSGAIERAEAEIDGELADVEAERTAVAHEVGDEVLAEYESIRRRLGGIAVARLVDGTCSGCNLTLSAVEQDRIKHEADDARVYCEECGRLLAR